MSTGIMRMLAQIAAGRDRFAPMSVVMCAWIWAGLLATAPLPPPAEQALARGIFQELIEIDSTQTGSSTRVAQAVARRLEAAGSPKEDLHLFEPKPGKGNLVARLRGSGQRKPLMLLGHL